MLRTKLALDKTSYYFHTRYFGIRLDERRKIKILSFLDFQSLSLSSTNLKTPDCHPSFKPRCGLMEKTSVTASRLEPSTSKCCCVTLGQFTYLSVPDFPHSSKLLPISQVEVRIKRQNGSARAWPTRGTPTYPSLSSSMKLWPGAGHCVPSLPRLLLF